MAPLKSKNEELNTEIFSDPVETEEDVQVDARFRGKTDAVKTALRSYAEAPEESETQPEAEINQELDNKLSALLSDPKCFIIIERTQPVRFRGVHTAVEVDRMKCPITLSDIKERIQENHGGKKYRISIHPNSPTGEMRTLSAFPLEIPGEEPFLDESAPLPGGSRMGPRFSEEYGTSWADSLDPTAIDSEDPATILSQHYKGQAKTLADKIRVKTLKRSVRELDEEDEGGSTDEMQTLRNQMELSERDRRMDDRFSTLEEKLSGSNSSNEMLLAMMKMQEASNQANNQMRNELQQQNMQFITTMMEMNRSKGPEETFDSSLERMVKMKEAMEGKSNKIEGIMFDLLSDKLNGGSSDEDPVTVAVKEGLSALKPVLMELVSKKPGVSQAMPLSKEEATRAYQEEGRKAAQEIAQRMIEKQKAMALANPTPPPSSVASPAPSPVPMVAQPPMQGQEYQINPLDEVPPGPNEDGYTRENGINFVLSAILQEIKSGDWKSEEGSVVIGDFLDRLDRGLLLGLTQVTTGEQLDHLIKPFANPNLVSQVKQKGEENRAISAWLEHVLVSVKNEVIRAEEAFSASKVAAPGSTDNTPSPTHVDPPAFVSPEPTVLNPATNNIVSPSESGRAGETGAYKERHLLEDEENPIGTL